MPFTFTDEAEVDETQDQEESGSGLRKRLEEVLAQNRELSRRLSRFEAQEFLREKGYQIPPEKLLDIPRDKWEEKAKDLHEEMETFRREVIRDWLQSQGLSGDDLDAALNELRGDSEIAAARQRVAKLADIDSQPAPVVDTRKVSDPVELIRIGLKSGNNQKS